MSIPSSKQQESDRSGTESLRVSVIVPTLNEATNISKTIEKTRKIKPYEIIVVDGGSDDGTLELAEDADRCLTSPEGRSSQMNAGAEVATGDVLLFLHADCWIEEGAIEAIQEILQMQNVVGGCFRQKIDAQGMFYRLLERGNSLRVKTLKWAYGDQGIFVRKEAFQQADGFPHLKLMEDLYFMKKLKKLGKIVLVDCPIHISARRWKSQGGIRQTLRNWLLITLAHCGISPDRLARYY